MNIASPHVSTPNMCLLHAFRRKGSPDRWPQTEKSRTANVVRLLDDAILNDSVDWNHLLSTDVASTRQY